MALTPNATANRMMRIDFSLIEGGKVRATNSVEIAVYATRPTVARPTVAAADAKVAAFAKGLGYTVVADDQADIVLARSLDGRDADALRSGCRYVVFADGEDKTNRNLRVDTPDREQPFIPVVDDTPACRADPKACRPTSA